MAASDYTAPHTHTNTVSTVCVRVQLLPLPAPSPLLHVQPNDLLYLSISRVTRQALVHTETKLILMGCSDILPSS